MIANVNIDDVISFSNEIERQREKVSEMSAQINGMADEVNAQIEKEQKKAAEAIEKCDEGLAKLSNKINEINEKISKLSSKLSTTPPKIKKIYIDKDGEEYIVEEDNPEYINLQHQITMLQNQLHQWMNLSNQIDGIKQKLLSQSEMLDSGLEQISQTTSSIAGCNSSIDALSSEAIYKLDKIRDVVQGYKGTASSLMNVEKKGLM